MRRRLDELHIEAAALLARSAALREVAQRLDAEFDASEADIARSRLGDRTRERAEGRQQCVRTIGKWLTSENNKIIERQREISAELDDLGSDE